MRAHTGLSMREAETAAKRWQGDADFGAAMTQVMQNYQATGSANAILQELSGGRAPVGGGEDEEEEEEEEGAGAEDDEDDEEEDGEEQGGAGDDGDDGDDEEDE